MGEKSYRIGDKYIQFSESDDEFCCLCTFPHNDGEELGPDRMISLSLFGAVVRLIIQGYYDDPEYDYIFIPQDVPDWILRDIRKLAESLTSGKDGTASQAEADRGTLPGALLKGWLDEYRVKS